MARQEIDEETIRRRAFEISQREDAGDERENWDRAERELPTEESGEPWAKTSSGDADSVTEP